MKLRMKHARAWIRTINPAIRSTKRFLLDSRAGPSIRMEVDAYIELNIDTHRLIPHSLKWCVHITMLILLCACANISLQFSFCACAPRYYIVCLRLHLLFPSPTCRRTLRTENRPTIYIYVTNLGWVRCQYHTNNEQTQSVEGII